MEQYNYAKILHNLITSFKVHAKQLHASSTKCKHKITNWKFAASFWGKPEWVADQKKFYSMYVYPREVEYDRAIVRAVTVATQHKLSFTHHELA